MQSTHGENKMSSDNKNAKIAGASFLISYLGLFAGAIVLAPILEDYLALAYPNAIQVGIGLLLESVNGIAVIGIAVMLYPILKRYNEGVALGYLAFRGVEAFLSILGSTKAASLIELSHDFIEAGFPAGSYFETFGNLVLADRHWTMEMLSVFFILGALIFYYLLYQSEIVPRYISLWGIIAVILVTAMNVIIYLGITIGMIGLFLVLPMIANEFFVAFWLIVKGVNTSTLST
jgi:hypothetical protein